MRQLCSELIKRLGAGECAALVSVVERRGSAPRGPGARMLVDAQGYVWGTVGGGKMEQLAIGLGQQVMEDGTSFTHDFVLRNDEAAGLGLVCGGDTRLYFQRLSPADAPLCEALLLALDAGRDAFWVTDLASGQMRVVADRPAPSEDAFTQQIASASTVHVFGGGHVAQALVPVLAKAGFRCAVLDDRTEFASAALFPDAASVQVIDFGALSGANIGPDDDVVIMTRGHQYDQDALVMALSTRARSIGMMGSAAKRHTVYANVRALGFTDADLARVCSPIGLPIRAETPFEIAISIAAQLILVRAGQ